VRKTVQNSSESENAARGEFREILTNMEKANSNNNQMFNGSSLTPDENYLIKTVECATTGAEIFSDYTDYQADGFNYEMKLLRCPANCNVGGTTVGLGQHPQSSPVCVSAIVDGAMPVHGGVISISKYNGATGYDGARFLVHGISVKKGQLETVDNVGIFSYSVSKVDNVDLMTQNVRILNYKGEPDNRGRVEMRLNGEWGSFSS
jgi:hypothetical protein